MSRACVRCQKSHRHCTTPFEGAACSQCASRRLACSLFDAAKATHVLVGDGAVTGDRIVDDFTFRTLREALLSLPRVQLLLFGVGAKFRLRCDDGVIDAAPPHMTIDGVNSDACALTGLCERDLVGAAATTVLQCRRVVETAYDLPDCVRSMTAECTMLRVATPLGQKRVHVVGEVELSPSLFTSMMHVRALTMTVLSVFGDPSQGPPPIF